jgi:uncharacterized membrane protein
MFKFKQLFFIIAVFILLAVPFASVFAFDWTTDKSLGDILTDLIDWLLTLVAVIGIIMIVIGGIVYITAAGSQTRLDWGKKILFYAVFGLLLCGISYVIIKTVTEIIAE